MTAAIPGHISFAVPASWSVMLLGAPLLLINRSVQFTLIHLLGLLFVIYAAFSLVWAPNGYWGFVQIIAIAGVFALASTEDFKIKPVLKGLTLGLIASDFIAFLQLFEFKGVLSVGFSGLFVNPNIFAEVSALILVLLLINKMWLYSIVTLPGLFVSSRAVMLGLAGALIVWIWRKSKIAVGVIGVLSLALLWYMTTYRYMRSVNQRLGIWQDMMAGFNLFGNGIGSFEYLFPIYNVHLDAAVNRTYQAHNEFLQTIFELGFIGAALLSAIIILSWNSKYAPWLVCFLIISCFGFPLHIAATAFMFAIVMGHISVNRNYIWNKRSDIRSTLSLWISKQRYVKIENSI